MKKRLRLGVSACLLGQRVRYDGGHKLNRFLRDTLGRYVDFVPVCPEVECGLSVPREPMRLKGEGRRPRLVTVRTRVDHTARLGVWAGRRLGQLERERLAGFILKADSPSCGLRRVRLYGGRGAPSRRGVGLWARALVRRFPRLPVEEDERLTDPALLGAFLARVFAGKGAV